MRTVSKYFYYTIPVLYVGKHFTKTEVRERDGRDSVVLRLSLTQTVGVKCLLLRLRVLDDERV